MKAHLTRFYFRIRYSIGYYPTLIGMAYFAFAMIVVALPGSDFWRPLKPFLTWVELPRVHNAEVVLPALITGIISFVTLSFAMVMVVLSNVSTTFSPKVLLGLVTEKKHQVVLGNYIGAILYCLILLLTITDGKEYGFRNLAVILAAAMAIWCLVLFVYFIHNISTSVQISTIVEKIYNDTRKELSRLEEAEKEGEWSRQAHVDEQIQPRHVFPSKASGYLQRIDMDDLVQVAKANELVIRVLPRLGDFVVKGYPIFACTKTPDQVDAAVSDRIFETFTFFSGEKIEINEKYGFSQLMEIAVKALSPGINDPGTACICIDYLTDLFVRWIKLRHSAVYYDENQKPRLIVRDWGFEKLFSICIGPIQRYGKNDLLVADKLLQSFKVLSHFDRKENRYKSLLNGLALRVVEDIGNSSTERHDLGVIHERTSEMNADPDEYFKLPQGLGSV